MNLQQLWFELWLKEKPKRMNIRNRFSSRFTARLSGFKSYFTFNILFQTHPTKKTCKDSNDNTTVPTAIGLWSICVFDLFFSAGLTQVSADVLGAGPGVDYNTETPTGKTRSRVRRTEERAKATDWNRKKPSKNYSAFAWLFAYSK